MSSSSASLVESNHQISHKSSAIKVDTFEFKNEMESKFAACMILGGVGDAMGYNNGDWEFCFDGKKIHAEMANLTKRKGISALEISKDWIVSDDTVMHIATAEALLDDKSVNTFDDRCKKFAVYYINCMNDMTGRSAGMGTQASIAELKHIGVDNWMTLTLDSKGGGGCGAAMRAMIIGLAFYKHDDELIAHAVESGRLTHYNPTGYLGSVGSAYFASLALREVPISLWPSLLIYYLLPKVEQYIRRTKREVDENIQLFDYFRTSWIKYMTFRKLNYPDIQKELLANENNIKQLYYDKYKKQESSIWFDADHSKVTYRDKLYKSFAFRDWGGSSGHDSIIIAYDALLYSKQDWPTFCLTGVLHGGDNDSTGSIGGALYGALYGFDKTVPINHWKELEYKDKLVSLGKSMYNKYYNEDALPFYAVPKDSPL